MAGSFSPECNQGDDKSCKISYIFRMKEREREGKKSERRKFLLVKDANKENQSCNNSLSSELNLLLNSLSLFLLLSESFPSLFLTLQFPSPTTFINITCMRWFFLSILLLFFSFVRNQKLSCKKLSSAFFFPWFKKGGNEREKERMQK